MTYDMTDLTMSEVLKDPMIRQLLRADGVSLSAFAVLLDDAARQRNLALRCRKVGVPAAHVIDSLSHVQAPADCL
ncbi:MULTISPECIES: hypothetical protein [Rhizobium/Agrobacterium group]|uniref:hypothetical protein n=1 Tax=Rhizobium/Agrobacterium group TaxID=227290 RepID=UPI0012E7FD0F|nr:hypothetical protein [Allorhizobium ampelinum]MVA50578.1 hypothetical protein [Agrobacterium vitis]NSZ53453.1 hypothetical protein [Agrobacterium vitis]NTA32212.1 hypothetical protein [Agrobacterium vitis]